MVSTAQLWINGSPCHSSTKKTFDVLHPVSQSVVSRASAASSEDALAAIIAADGAAAAWEAVPAPSKRDIFLKAAELMRSPKYAARVIETMQEETGVSEAWASLDVHSSTGHLLSVASAPTEMHGSTNPCDTMPGGIMLVERRPFGTVLAISPFNAVSLVVRAVAIAIACGNTVVLKSSELSPRCTEIVVEVFHEAGLPKGVLNLLHVAMEDCPKIVADIIGHELIRHINFTGSDRVGKIIATEAAKHLKPCVLELGGKSAVIVLNDANVEEAARSIIFGAMYNSGQICMSTERVIVQRDISSSLIETLTSLAQKIRAGTSSSDQLRPVISSASAAKVLSMVSDAQSRGAKVIVGDLTRDGATVQPHIVVGIEPGWPMWDGESFGPVFGIKIVDTDEEAVRLANKTTFTLVGSVWTTNIERGLKVARCIRAGQALINSPTLTFEPRLGVHGLGGSTGYGRFDIESFTQLRGVIIAPAGLQIPPI